MCCQKQLGKAEKKPEKDKKLSNGNGSVTPDENSNDVKKSVKKRKKEDAAKEEQMVPLNAGPNHAGTQAAVSPLQRSRNRKEVKVKSGHS